MDVQRISVAEGTTAFLVAELPTGETVNVDRFFNMVTETSPVLTSSVATEITGTGVYYWCLDNMDTAPSGDMDIVWRMKSTSTGRTALGHLIIGGYTDLPKDNSVALDTIDGIVDAILVDTDTTIPGLIATVDSNVDAILVDTGATIPSRLDDVDTVVADILVDTGTTIPGTIATIDGIVDAILVDTGTDIPAAFAVTDGKIDVVDGIVDSILVDTAVIGTAVALDGGAATLGGMLTKMADDNGGADFDATTDSLTEIAAGESTAPTVTQIREEMDANSTQLAAIVADTGDVLDKMEGGSLPPNPVQWATT